MSSLAIPRSGLVDPVALSDRLDRIEQILEAIHRRESVTPAVYTVAEAARRLGSSPRTVRRMVERGQLARLVGVSSKLLIPCSEVEGYIEKNSVATIAVEVFGLAPQPGSDQ